LVARTPDQARQSATPMPTIMPEQSSGTSPQSDYTQFLSLVAKNPSLVTGYSKLLKAAGYYKGKITDKYTPALQKAFTKAEEDRLLISAARPMTRDEFLQDTIDLGGVGGDVGDGGPTIRKDIRITDETTARTLINAVLEDAIGRGATKEELKKYTLALQKAQREAPTVTTYSTAGDVQTATTTGGINEEEFLIQQIAGTDEAKANKVFNYYDAFKTALGVR
jgi:hypothetical protein